MAKSAWRYRGTLSVPRAALILVLAVAVTGERCPPPKTGPTIEPPPLGPSGDAARQAIEQECKETLAYATRFKKSPQASSGLAAPQVSAYTDLVPKLNGLLDRVEQDDQSSDQDFLSAAVDMVGANAVFNSTMEGILGGLGPGQLGNYVLTHNPTLPANWVTLRSATRPLSEPDRAKMSTYLRSLRLPVWASIQ